METIAKRMTVLPPEHENFIRWSLDQSSIDQGDW